MPPKHKKHGRMMVLTTRFDDGSENRNGEVFSVVHARAGLGLCAHGTVSHASSLRSKPIPTCKVKCDDDGGSKSLLRSATVWAKKQSIGPICFIALHQPQKAAAPPAPRAADRPIKPFLTPPKSQ